MSIEEMDNEGEEISLKDDIDS